MAFKLIEAAQDRWRAVNGPHLVTLIRAGATFVDGRLVERPVPPTRPKRSSSTGMGYCSAPIGSPGRAAAPRRGWLGSVGAQADLSEDRLAPPPQGRAEWRVRDGSKCSVASGAAGAGWVRYAVRGRGGGSAGTG